MATPSLSEAAPEPDKTARAQCSLGQGESNFAIGYYRDAVQADVSTKTTLDDDTLKFVDSEALVRRQWLSLRWEDFEKVFILEAHAAVSCSISLLTKPVRIFEAPMTSLFLSRQTQRRISAT